MRTSTIHVDDRRTGHLRLLTVDTGPLRLSLLPEVGGRLISLRYREKELLWHNPHYLDDRLDATTHPARWPVPDGSMGSWVNLGGSKTWPAPQGWDNPGQWAGPPDPVLDGGPYAVEVARSPESLIVRLISGVDPVTGISIQREITTCAGGTGFWQVATIRNHGSQPAQWSVWDVTQVNTAGMATQHRRECGVFVRVDPHPPILSLLDVTGTARFRRIGATVHVPVQNVVAKLGFPGATGLVSFRRPDGVALSIDFELVPGANYPDGGCPVELWLQHCLEAPLERFGGLHPDADLIELEILSPLATIAPGGMTSLTTVWTVSSPSAG